MGVGGQFGIKFSTHRDDRQMIPLLKNLMYWDFIAILTFRVFPRIIEAKMQNLPILPKTGLILAIFSKKEVFTIFSKAVV